jgi:transposase
MPKAYSLDLRERVVAACEAGESAREVAERFAVSESFIEKLKRHRAQTGSLAPKPHAGGQPPRLAAQDDRLRDHLRHHPDTTLAELRDHLALPVALSTLWYHLQRLGLTFKKMYGLPLDCKADVGQRTKAVCVNVSGLWSGARSAPGLDEIRAPRAS